MLCSIVSHSSRAENHEEADRHRSAAAHGCRFHDRRIRITQAADHLVGYTSSCHCSRIHSRAVLPGFTVASR